MYFTYRSITDSSQVGCKIIFNILVQPKLTQTCYEQINCIKYYRIG